MTFRTRTFVDDENDASDDGQTDDNGLREPGDYPLKTYRWFDGQEATC